MTDRTVAIIGGGLAGLAAALAAADAGAEVVLLERQRRLGGLTWSFRRNGRWFDNGQHVFLRCFTAYRGLLGRLGVVDSVTLQDRLDVPVIAPGGRVAHIRRGPGPVPLHLGAALARFAHLSVRDRIGLIRAVGALTRLDHDDGRLDERTFGSWLVEHGQRPEAVERLWNLITLPTVNLPAGEASLQIAAMVFQTALFGAVDAGDIGWSRVPLAELHDRSGRRALAAAGVEVHLGHPATAVRPVGDRWQVATVGTGRDGTSEGASFAAAAVILAVPPATAAALAPAGVVPDAGGLGSSPIVNVHLVLDRQVTDLPFVAGVGSPVQYVFDRTGSGDGGGQDPARGAQQLAISLSGAEAFVGRRPEVLIGELREALGELFPEARRATLVDAVVTKEREATFRAAPGSARLRPEARTALPGLALAGAWTATGWPATMEGAVRSGHAAAEVVLGSLGVSAAGALAAPTPSPSFSHRPEEVAP